MKQMEDGRSKRGLRVAAAGLALLLAAGLAGCSGGGGGGGAPPPDPAEGETWDKMAWDRGTWA